MNLDSLPPVRPEARLFYADMVLNRIEKLIAMAQDKLEPDQALLVEVPLGDGRTIAAEFFGFQNPNFVVVSGRATGGQWMTALLSHTNIQVLMTAVPITERTVKEIGFQAAGS